ncbi:MAG: ankyrin repeat domain-containing protein [Candidatus Sericytochromatia bacterium]|nr:ankyrin repeat domain-containing protein [Candidatus Sericytochromatia bacterium]
MVNELKYWVWRLPIAGLALSCLLSGCLDNMLNLPAPVRVQWDCLNVSAQTQVSDEEVLLIRLIKNQDHQALIALLERYPNLLENNPNKMSALHVAAYFGNLPALKTILEKGGGHIDSGTCQGNSPLHFAAFSLQTQAVTFLLAQGANPQVANTAGDTPLHFVSGVPVEWLYLSTQTEFPLSLIAMPEKLRAELLPVRTSYADLKQAQKQIIDTLLQAGVPVDIKNKQGQTPLFYAAMSKDVEAFRQLNLADGYILAKDQSNQSLLHQLALGPLPLETLLKLPKDPRKWSDAAIYQAKSDREKPLLTLIQAMIQLGVPFDTGDRQGLRPLHMAARTGQESILALLLQAGANTNAPEDGADPLALASAVGDLAAVQSLVKAGARLNFFLKDSHALAEAARYGHESVVDYLLQQGYRIELSGVSALTAAVTANQENMVKLLLRSGAQINYQSPLAAAFQQKNLGLVQLLLDAGADPQGLDLNGNAAWAAISNDNPPFGLPSIDHSFFDEEKPSLDAVAFFRQLPVKPVLRSQNVQGETLLHTWLKANQAVSLLEAAGPVSDTVNLPNREGNTVLQEAVKAQKLTWVKALLAQGADLNWANNQGETALDLAIAGGDAEILDYVAGLPGQNLTFRQHSSAYLQALANGHLTSIEKLTQQADWDSLYHDKTGKSLWGYFFEKQSGRLYNNTLALLNLLLKAGLNPNQALDPEAGTPLHFLSKNADVEGVKRVLAKGADPNLNMPHNPDNNLRETPLHIAVNSNAQAVIDELLRAKADPRIHNGEGKTALHLCVQAGQAETLQKFLAEGWKLDIADWQDRGLLWQALEADQTTLLPTLLAKIPQARMLKDLNQNPKISTASLALLNQQPALKAFLETSQRPPL